VEQCGAMNSFLQLLSLLFCRRISSHPSSVVYVVIFSFLLGVLHSCALSFIIVGLFTANLHLFVYRYIIFPLLLLILHRKKVILPSYILLVIACEEIHFAKLLCNLLRSHHRNIQILISAQYLSNAELVHALSAVFSLGNKLILNVHVLCFQILDGVLYSTVMTQTNGNLNHHSGKIRSLYDRL